MREAPTDQAIDVDPVHELLTSWNDNREQLTDDTRAGLLRLARLELGLPDDATLSDKIHSVGELAAAIRPGLPVDRKGRTLADTFIELRSDAARQLRLRDPSAIGWWTSWEHITSEREIRFRRLWSRTTTEYLQDLLMPIPFLQNAHEPVDLVGEVARLLWRSRGGTPFWVLPAYETDWCASLGVFNDLRRQLKLTCGAAADEIQPATPIRSLMERSQEPDLLYALERTFGVWLGRRGKEGCLPVLIAGIIASPLGWFAGIPLILALDGSGVVLVLWMITCWIIAGAIYVRSQPRLPAHVRTIKDLVREIVHRRSAQGATQKRIRPPAVACRS